MTLDVLHQSTGILGMAPRPAKPHAPITPDPHRVPRQAAELRKVYAALIGCGYTRELTPPGFVHESGLWHNFCGVAPCPLLMELSPG